MAQWLGKGLYCGAGFPQLQQRPQPVTPGEVVQQNEGAEQRALLQDPLPGCQRCQLARAGGEGGQPLPAQAGKQGPAGLGLQPHCPGLQEGVEVFGPASLCGGRGPGGISWGRLWTASEGVTCNAVRPSSVVGTRSAQAAAGERAV